MLAGGGSALDAVEAAVRVLEDDPHFNAGRGACFTREGTNELDAAIMDGRDRRAGSVAGVTRTRNPVSLARKVMEASPHVLLAGSGADRFAVEQGLEQVDPSWFHTDERRRQLDELLSRGADAFDSVGNAGPTIWVDGRVVGAWAQRPDGELLTHYFLDVPRRTRAAVEAEAARLHALVGETRFSVRFPSHVQKRLLSCEG